MYNFKDNGKHVGTTLRIFWRWSRIGFIGGQQKEKYGSIRWYAHIGSINNLHDIMKIGHVCYRWDPLDYPVLDFLNNMSKFLFKLKPVQYLTYKYMVLIYNLAYRHAMLASPGYEAEVLRSCYHTDVIWGYKKLEKKYFPNQEQG